jgi:hypothetical protein
MMRRLIVSSIWILGSLISILTGYSLFLFFLEGPANLSSTENGVLIAHQGQGLFSFFGYWLIVFPPVITFAAAALVNWIFTTQREDR